jgi:hypothetical protein
MTLYGSMQDGHGHGHGVFILATHPPSGIQVLGRRKDIDHQKISDTTCLKHAINHT